MQPAPPLHDYQKEAIVKGVNLLRNLGNKGYGIIHDPGLGKTYSALFIAGILKLPRVAVLTPPAGNGAWREMTPQVLKGWDFQVVRGEDKITLTDPAVLVTNYSQLLAPKRVRQLRRWKPDLLILDECQLVKGAHTTTTRAVNKIAEVAKHVILLSGSPVHEPVDWWSLMRLIAPKEPAWQMTSSTFRSWLAVMGGPHGNWVLRYKKQEVDKLMATIQPYIHFADASIRKGKPPTHQVIRVPLGESDRKLYDDLERDLRVRFPDGAWIEAPMALVEMLRLQQITGGFATTTTGEIRSVSRAKPFALYQLLDERREYRTLVACRFKAEVAEAEKVLRRLGIQHHTIDGDTGPGQREQYQQWFQGLTGPGALVLQYRAGGVSLTLSNAHYLLIYSLEPSVVAYRQIIGRIWRPAETVERPNHQVLYLVAENTVDEDILAGVKSGADKVDLNKYIARGVMARG